MHLVDRDVNMQAVGVVVDGGYPLVVCQPKRGAQSILDRVQDRQWRAFAGREGKDKVFNLV